MAKIDVVGTGYRETRDATYAQLVRVFGEPNGEVYGNKTDAEWHLGLNGVVFTIYNYKDGHNFKGEAGLPVQSITRWNVGGRSRSAVLVEVVKALTAKEQQEWVR